MSDSGGGGGAPHGFFQDRFGQTDISGRQATGCITIVYGGLGVFLGAVLGMGLSAVFRLSPTSGGILSVAAALIGGVGSAWTARRIARRGTEDKRLERLRAEYGDDSDDSDAQQDGEP